MKGTQQQLEKRYAEALKKRTFASNEEERDNARIEAKALLEQLHEIEKQSLNNSENEAARVGGRGGKMYGASHTLKSFEEPEAGSARPHEAQALTACQIGEEEREGRPLKSEGVQLNKFGTRKQIDTEKVEELAEACVRMFGEADPIATKKKCANAIYRALQAGISEERIEFDISDSAVLGRSPLGFFLARMARAINQEANAVPYRRNNRMRTRKTRKPDSFQLLEEKPRRRANACR